jgi:hypothetical protein
MTPGALGRSLGPMAYAAGVTRARAADLMRPHRGAIRFVALAALGILAAHDTVFVAQFGLGSGYEAAMARTAHGYWPAFALFTLLVAGAGALTAVHVLARLGRMVRGLPPSPRHLGQAAWWSEVRRLWPRLLAVMLVGFAIQENVEHALAGGGWPGLWVLAAPDYPLAIPSILAVSGLLAAIGGWLQWRRAVLIERLRAARPALHRGRHGGRAPHRRWALLAALLANRWALLRRDAERAPPLASAA